jgi:hypothetical protein
VFPDSFLVVPRASGHVFIFSYFDLSTVPRVTGPIFMFYASGLIFGGTEGIESRFHVLGYRTRFRRFGGRRVSISCFSQPDSFSAVPRASGPVYMFCAPGLVFGGIEGVGSRFHILLSRTRFQRYRGRQIPFSCIACPDLFPPYQGRLFPF